MKKYKVIYADPPWRFKNFSEKGEGRNAISHYDCLTLADLKKLNISRYADKLCTFYVGNRSNARPGFRINESFNFKTVAFYWAKTNTKVNLNKLSAEKDFFTGLGYWTRANVEQCIMGTIGNPKRVGKDVKRLIIDKRREHSRKPEQTYERIEKLVQGPYLELFARKTKSNWDSWGIKLDYLIKRVQ